VIGFETAVVSSPGGREHNEDYCGHRMKELSGCWALADGLGGHLGGAVASRVAVEAGLDSFESDSSATEAALELHAARANRAVLDRQVAEPDLVSMRTTIVMLVANQEAAIAAHSGDSRLYWFRDGALKAQTRDHSVPGSLAAAGEITPGQIRFHEDRGRLLRSLGAKPDAQVTIGAIDNPPRPRDAFLLASDGFWEWVDEAEMQEDLGGSASAQDWLDRMQARLEARAQPDHDNFSAIAVLINGGSK